MRHVRRIGSFRGGRLAKIHTKFFHQAPRPAAQRKTVTEYDSKFSAASILQPQLEIRGPEERRKDRLLEYLIRKSLQASSNSERQPISSKMPKNTPHHVRTKGKSHIQFITTPTSDTPGTALLLCFEEKRYMIGNIHEGLQRAGLQVGTRIFKTQDFFLTGKTEWRSNGGLLGMLLSLADANKSRATSKAEVARLKQENRVAREEEQRQNWARRGRKGHPGKPAKQEEPEDTEKDPTVTLHGGPNLTHTIATARSFIFRNGTPIKVNEIHEEKELSGPERDWKPTWEDEKIHVWAMAVSPPDRDEDLRPISPRKRSLGEYMAGQSQELAEADDQWSIHPKTPIDAETRNQQIRDFTVSEMFNSSWRYDNLVETPLHEVSMPAGLFTRDPETRKLVKYTGPVPDGTRPIPNIKVWVRQPWPGALVDRLPPTKPSTTAMSYIIRNRQQRGKFKPEAANALKVPPGPLWAVLARGSEVQSSDGKTITSEMVLEPSKDGNGVAVVDLPSKDYIPDLINRPEWNIEKIMTGIGAIVWILGPGLAHDQALRDFISDKPSLKHIVSSTDHCPNYLSQTSAAAAAIRHNQIDPARFPIPVHSNATPLPLDVDVGEADRSSHYLLSAKRGLRIDLEPSFGIVEHEVVPFLNTAQVVKGTPQVVLDLAQIAQKEIDSHSSQMKTAGQNLPSQDAEIICLGTGSALPSKYRNVSATLLRVPGHGSYLLDCGEDTLGQLKRVFTESELAEVLQDLKLIWISHLHADHHLGITSVIRAWYEEVHGREPAKRRRPPNMEQLLDPAKVLEEGKRLCIVGHHHMMRWLEEYSSVEDFGYNQLMPLRSFPANRNQPSLCHLEWNGLNVGFNTTKDPRVKSAIRKATSLSNLVAAAVSHCYGSQAVSLSFPNGFKFSYSGDCRPSTDFTAIGQGSTVLLHEATFDDELQGDAEAKRHSTTSEAIGVGLAMGAKRVLLTHFSQRYQKIPNTGSLDSLSVRLEDAEEVDDPMENLEPPMNAEDEPPVDTTAPINNLLEGLGQEKVPERTKGELQDRWTIGAGPALDTLESTTNLLRPTANVAHDIRVGVAFDYMRIKVGDIMHLENFTPAMRELYKETGKAEKEEHTQGAAKKAFSDDEKDVTPAVVSGAEVTRASPDEKQMEGQMGKKERKERKRAQWEKEKNQKEGGKSENAVVLPEAGQNETPSLGLSGRKARALLKENIVERYLVLDSATNEATTPGSSSAVAASAPDANLDVETTKDDRALHAQNLRENSLVIETAEAKAGVPDARYTR